VAVVVHHCVSRMRSAASGHHHSAIPRRRPEAASRQLNPMLPSPNRRQLPRPIVRGTVHLHADRPRTWHIIGDRSQQRRRITLNPLPNHAGLSCGSRISGIRSCSSPTASLAFVGTMVNVRWYRAPSHFFMACNSHKPSAVTTRRRQGNAALTEATVIASATTEVGFPIRMMDRAFPDWDS
jgi:hypothetical protein